MTTKKCPSCQAPVIDMDERYWDATTDGGVHVCPPNSPTRMTAEREREIREKVAEWDRLASERPQQFAHTKTTLAVCLLLAELDAVRGERGHGVPEALTDTDVDYVLERFDQSDPTLQRQIVASLVHRIATLTRERDAARGALEEIIDPIPAMDRRARADGMRLNGYAAAIANDAEYLRTIARRGLRTAATPETL